MTHIHYKFSSRLTYDTVLFDGPHITLSDLKSKIMTREKLRAADCDLLITNAQTKEDYTDDNSLIPKASSVIIRRIPVSRLKSSSSRPSVERPDMKLHHTHRAGRAVEVQSTSRAFFSKIANLADADVPEEDKIRAMMFQSNYDIASVSTKHGSTLPVNYTCYRCGSSGHHIRDCPTSGDKSFETPLKIKKSTGIPRSFMVEVDDPSIKGVMLTNSGRYAIPTIDAEAYAIGKKEKPPFIQQIESKREHDEVSPPEELLCLICHDLLTDAVIIPCCGTSFCDDCVRSALLDSEDHICPTCQQPDVSPDSLIANRFLRQAINTFKKERGLSRTSSQAPLNTPSQPPSQPLSLLPSQPPSQTPNLELTACSRQDSETSADTETHSTSMQETHLETSVREAQEEVAAVPSILLSIKDPAAPPQPAKDSETVSVKQQPSSTGSPTSLSACRDRSSSSTGVSSCSRTESNTEWSRSSSTSFCSSSSSTHSSASSPHFPPSPLFNTFLSAYLPHTSFPPGYPPVTPFWMLPAPQGAPVPPICSSPSSSLMPLPTPKDWVRYQRSTKDRSPRSGSSHTRSSFRSTRSSHSSRHRSRSRSGSRSRSRSRSRRRSPRSHRLPSCSHTSNYKRSRSPTPSRSRSPSDTRTSCHHSRKWSRSSRSGGERLETSSGLTGILESERHLQWRRYEECCEKYLSSCHQLPVPLYKVPLPPYPPPSPRWGDRDVRRPPHRRSTTRQSPSSESSSDSRSPPSQSSSDSHSTPSQSSRDSRSSLPKSSDGRSTPPEDRAYPKKPTTERHEDVKDFLRHKKTKKPERGGEESSSSSDAVDRKRRHNTQEPMQDVLKPYQPVNKDNGGRVREETERRRGGKNSDGEGQYEDSRVENRKRRGDDLQTDQGQTSLKTKPAEEPETCQSKEPLDTRDIWEGGVTVRPLRKISFNINLQGRWKEEEPLQEEVNKEQGGAEGRSRDQHVTCPAGEDRGGEEEQKEDLDLWHCALGGGEVRGELAETGRENTTEDVETRRQQEEEDKVNNRTDCSQEETQERRTVENPDKEDLQDGAADGQDKLAFIQMPQSKWEEGDQAETRVHTDNVPHPDNGQQRQKPEQMDRDRGRDRERASSLSHRCLAPTAGRDRSDKNRGRDRPKDRDTGRDYSSKKTPSSSSSSSSRGRERRERWQEGNHATSRRSDPSRKSFSDRTGPYSVHPSGRHPACPTHTRAESKPGDDEGLCEEEEEETSSSPLSHEKRKSKEGETHAGSTINTFI